MKKRDLLWLFIGIWLCIIVMFFTACSSVKHIQQSKRDSLATKKVNTSISEKENTQTITDVKTKTIKKADSVVTFPGSELVGSSSIESLKSNPLTLEDANQKIDISVDQSGKVSIKAQDKPKKAVIKIDETTEVDKKTNETSKVDFKAKINVDTKVKTQQKSFVKYKQTSFAGWHWWYWIIIILIAAGWAYLKFRSKIFALWKK